MRSRLDTLARTWALGAFVGWVVLLAFTFGIVANVQAAAVELNDQQAPPRVEQRRDTPQTTFEAVGSTVMCPSCDTTLDQSESPAAQRMRAWVEAAVAAGWTEDEIRDGLVAEYGGDESVLATPRAQGLGLAVWIVPALVALVALVAGFLLVRRWSSADQTRSGSSSSSQLASGSTSTSSQSSTPGSSDEPSSSASDSAS